MARLFGTDGVRGIANVELTPELAFKLGRAAASYFGRETRNPKSLSGATHAFPAPCWKLRLLQVSARPGAMRTFWV